MSHNTLEDYYALNFALRNHHKWSIREVEEMIVYERDIEVDMLIQFLEYKKQLEKDG